MTFQPRHRGTPTQFKAENAQARDWFMAQCRRVIADLDDDIKATLEEQFTEIEAKEDNQDGFMNGGFFRMHWHREGGHYYWSNPGNRESSEYMWWFEIGDSGKTRYGSRQKIKIRKDGSIHEANLKEALHYWARREISRKRCADIHAANTEEWEQLQSPGKHDQFITVTLSKGKLGMCDIKYSNTWVVLGAVRDVPIQNARRMIDKMMSVAENFAADAVEIRDDI
jgi:hypothetical protein